MHVQVINASRRCVFVAANLMESYGDVLLYRDKPYLEKMETDALPILDLRLVRASLKGRRLSRQASVK